MRSTVTIWTLFIIFNMIHGYTIETVEEWNSTNTFHSFYPYYLSHDTLFLYSAKVDKGLLTILSTEQVNYINCTVPYKKDPNRRPMAIQKIENNKVLVHYLDSIEIVNTTSCKIDTTLNKNCQRIIPQAEFFDCISETYYFYEVTRYSYKKDLIDSFKIKNFDYVRIFQELPEPNANGTMFVLQGKFRGQNYTINILNSTYSLEKKFDLKLDFSLRYSLTHDQFSSCTNVDSDGSWLLQNIECVLFSWTSEPGKISKVKITPGTITDRFGPHGVPNLIVQNLPGGGAIIFYGDRTERGPTTSIFYRIIDADGQLKSKEEVFYEFQKYDEDDLPVFNVFKKGESICGAILGDRNVVTKCFKFSW